MEDPKELGALLLEELNLLPDPGRTVGAPTRAVITEYTRDLTEADMAALALPRGHQPKTLARLRASHHSLARCLASGMRPVQAALVTGYTQSTISVLQTEPSFMALVEDYRLEGKAIFADLVERMSDLSLDAMELLQEKLHDNPEQMTPAMLLDIIKAFADRTGHGPNQEVNLKVSADFIDRPPRESFEDWEKRRQGELQSQRATPDPRAASADLPIDLMALAPPPKKPH